MRAGIILWTDKTLHNAITWQPGCYFFYGLPVVFIYLVNFSASENEVNSLQCCLTIGGDRTVVIAQSLLGIERGLRVM